jgi:FKBP-type peptidyl-prolyl cis-trans isomerase 2
MVNKGDMVLLELEGKDKGGNVFDSTSGDAAKRLHGKEGPILLSFGFDKIIPGLFDAVSHMRKGEDKEISLSPDKAFGKRNKDLVKIMSLAEFRKFRVNPEPGLLIHVDTDKGRTYGTVKSVSNGRVMVDFNHPLASKPVYYKVKLVDVFSDPESKVKALCEDSGVVEKWSMKDGILELKFKDGLAQDKETRKALLLIMLKTRVEGLKKIDIGQKHAVQPLATGTQQPAFGKQLPASADKKPKSGN